MSGLTEVEQVRMGWAEDGLVVLVAHLFSFVCDPASEDCDEDDEDDDYDDEDDDDDEPDFGYALSSLWWERVGELPSERMHTKSRPSAWIADPDLRWLAWIDEQQYARSSFGETLNVVGTTGRSSELTWTEYPDNYIDEERSGGWRVDVVTQWLESYSILSEEPYQLAESELGWQAIVVEPRVALHKRTTISEWGYPATGTIEILAAADGAAAVEWEACSEQWSDGDGDGEDDSDDDDFDGDDDLDDDYSYDCRSATIGVGDCELLDVSPSLTLALASCEAGLQLIEIAEGTKFAALPYGAGAIWRWSRANTLILFEPGQPLGVYSLSTGKLVHSRANVEALPEVPLATEQDRLLLGYPDHWELVVGSTGEQLLEVSGSLDAAALSPDGTRIAVTHRGAGRVLEIAGGATIASFEVGDAWKIAWRQDGAALFYGYDLPTHAVDPTTGELLGALEHPVIDLAWASEIDPSWRWIHRPDGSIVRTLDFARIELDRWSARTDSGWFDGHSSHTTELMFRVGDEPGVVPRWTAKELAPWLRRPGLVEAFFVGEPLPTPSIPAVEYAKLEASR